MTAPADALARDHGISRATAYRYLDEVIMVLAGHAPELREALERAQDQGMTGQGKVGDAPPGDPADHGVHPAQVHCKVPRREPAAGRWAAGC